MEWIRRIFLLLIMSALPGCTLLGTYMSPQNPAPQYVVNGHVVKTRWVELNPTWVVQHDEPPSPYRIGSYDILNVIVWQHAGLTTPTTQLSSPTQSGFLVSSQGTISFPLAGTVKVAGLTLPQIQTVIASSISRYIRNPQVTVRVVKFRSQEIQILGEIGQQKAIPLTDRPTSLLDAISIAGGTNVATANTARIYVIRGNLKQLTVFMLNAKSPQAMMVAQRFILKNNDIVYVSPLGITNWNRVISQLMPTFGANQTVQSTVDTL